MGDEIKPTSFLARVFLRLLDWKFGVLCSITFALLFAAILAFHSLGIDFTNNKEIAQILAGMACAGIILSLFLGVAKKLDLLRYSESSSKDFEIIQSQIGVLNRQYKVFENTSGKVDISAAVSEEFSRLADDFTRTSIEQIETAVQNKHGSMAKNANISSIKSVFTRAAGEMFNQIEVQRNNSNANLFIGLVFATLGIVVLGIVFYTTYLGSNVTHNGENENITKFVLGFIPRVTFVVLVESVAFFFLNLYREDRNMIRFFRNEMTNLECRFIGLEAAARLDVPDALKQVILQFSSTERNFMVKKGDRHVLESMKENDERMFEKLVDKLSNNFDLSKIRRGNL